METEHEIFLASNQLLTPFVFVLESCLVLSETSAAAVEQTPDERSPSTEAGTPAVEQTPDERSPSTEAGTPACSGMLVGNQLRPRGNPSDST
ncbi:hypothetical protein ACOMHN_011913 [Nucella lapillus]